ncbi:clotting factor G beta subunit-like [Diabrotica virgifera virgifera]|uniref:Peptidase S1 domain-containing protein n=1 Tax=Diabrotica virgifera virgifera TaxID=50390 RepID=A0ABM5KHA2_DIAVI|nr:clotting factor G beta subunit-like [Diabrotica virgifera virgifera]
MGAKIISRHLFIFVIVSGVLTLHTDAAFGARVWDAIFNPCVCKCGVPNREARLVGGEYLTGHEFPWAASIQVNDGNSNVSSLAATLITPKYLLTSASNVIGITPRDIKVTLGQTDRCHPDTTSVNMSVDRIMIHPEYNPGSRAHDIALIRLNTPAKLDKRILPICLPSANYRYVNQVGIVYGWSDNGNVTCRAKKVGLPILTSEECLKGFNDPEYVTSDKGCLGVPGSVSPVCKGDSGSPVMYRSKHGSYDVVGVLGDKNECEEINLATYASVVDHLPWILQNTKDSCFCSRLNLQLPSLPKGPLKLFEL